VKITSMSPMAEEDRPDLGFLEKRGNQNQLRCPEGDECYKVASFVPHRGNTFRGDLVEQDLAFSLSRQQFQGGASRTTEKPFMKRIEGLTDKIHDPPWRRGKGKRVESQHCS